MINTSLLVVYDVYHVYDVYDVYRVMYIVQIYIMPNIFA